MKRCIRIWFMGAGCLLIFISHNAQALWPFGGGAQKKASIKKETSVADRIHEENRGLLEGMESQIEAYTKSADKASILLSTREPWRIWLVRKAVKPIVPDNKVDTCILGGSLLSLGVGLWVKSWLLDGCGVAGFGVYGYRRRAGMEGRIRNDIANLKLDIGQKHKDLLEAIEKRSDKVADTLRIEIKDLEKKINKKFDDLTHLNQKLSAQLKKEYAEQCKSQERRINLVLSRVTRLTRVIRSVNSQLSLQRKSIEGISSSHKEQSELVQTIGSDVHNIKGDLVVLRNSLKSDHSQISADLTANTAAIDLLRKEYEELRKKDLVLQENIEKWHNENKRDLESILCKTDDLQQQLTTLTQLHKEANSAIDKALKQGNQELARQLFEQYKRVQQQIADLSRQFVTKEEFTKAMNNVNTQLEDQSAQLEVMGEAVNRIERLLHLSLAKQEVVSVDSSPSRLTATLTMINSLHTYNNSGSKAKDQGRLLDFLGGDTEVNYLGFPH